jgi:pyruvate dehydrogenase E2 component (dihydrolipoamide acetyltransferase)
VAGEPEGAKGALRRVALERWQASLARRSAEARATIPDLELEVEVDAGMLGAAGSRRTAALIHACGRALREHPPANGSYRDGALELHDRVNVGVLLALESQQAIPTVFDADAKPPAEIERELVGLERAAREGSLLAPALAGATFTVWDLGELGIARGVPLVLPGQAAAIALGATRAVARAEEHSVFPGKAATATLASDHRILYGAAAAAFLLSIKQHLEEEEAR